VDLTLFTLLLKGLFRSPFALLIYRFIVALFIDFYALLLLNSLFRMVLNRTSLRR